MEKVREGGEIKLKDRRAIHMSNDRISQLSQREKRRAKSEKTNKNTKRKREGEKGKSSLTTALLVRFFGERCRDVVLCPRRTSIRSYRSSAAHTRKGLLDDA